MGTTTAVAMAAVMVVSAQRGAACAAGPGCLIENPAAPLYFMALVGGVVLDLIAVPLVVLGFRAQVAAQVAARASVAAAYDPWRRAGQFGLLARW